MLPTDCRRVRGDEARIGQVLVNLVHNAVKFSEGGGEVKVRVRDDGTELVVSVEDHGIGIPKADQGRIFERFYKVDRARVRGGGTGLGLSIARNVLQQHGGRIWVESEEGVGSTFSFALPVPVAADAEFGTLSAMARLTVATLNIRNLADRWDERLPLLLADMAALQPDVLGLQEVVYPLQQDRLIGAAGEGRYDGYRAWAGRPEYGNAMLVREPLSATVSQVERLELGLNRSALQLVLVLDDGSTVLGGRDPSPPHPGRRIRARRPGPPDPGVAGGVTADRRPSRSSATSTRSRTSPLPSAFARPATGPRTPMRTAPIPT